jgi:hypothetical protein
MPRIVPHNANDVGRAFVGVFVVAESRKAGGTNVAVSRSRTVVDQGAASVNTTGSV